MAAAPFDRFEQFFQPVDAAPRPRAPIRSLADFFPGAFAYHWHNAWQEPEDANSYYALFEREIDHRLAASRAAA